MTLCIVWINLSINQSINEGFPNHSSNKFEKVDFLTKQNYEK